MFQTSRPQFLCWLKRVDARPGYAPTALAQPVAGAAPAAPTSAVQKAQRRAAIGMSLRHSGHVRVVTSTGGSVLYRRISALTGLTTRKNTAAAMTTNEMRALMNAPYRKW